MAYNLLVCMGASELRGTMSLYLRQLAEAKIDTHVRDNSDMPNRDGGGNLGFRVKVFRELANRFKHYDKIVITDGFDVTFYSSEEDVIAKIPDAGLLHAAEKNFYPDDDSVRIRIENASPWKYANGGAVAGRPEEFIKWCDEVERHPRYQPFDLDQRFLNILVSERSPLCVIDDTCNLFFCLHSGYEELDFERGIPVNRVYDTHACFVHANGSTDATEMFAKYERSLQ